MSFICYTRQIDEGALIQRLCQISHQQSKLSRQSVFKLHPQLYYIHMPTTELGTPRLSNVRVLHNTPGARSVRSRTNNMNLSSKSNLENSTEFSCSRSFALDLTTSENIDDRAKKYLSALEEYCSQLIRERRKDFVDLVGFNEQLYNITLDDLMEAKFKAERITQLEDHTGMSIVDLGRAIEAGIMAFVELNLLTRHQLRALAKELADNARYLRDLTTATKPSEAKSIKEERDNFIVEAYVDLKQMIKSKYEVLCRVEEVVALDKIRELPDPKRLRSTANSKKIAGLKRSLDSAAVSVQTPPCSKQKRINPLDFDKIMDNFRDEQARDFIYMNQRSRRRTFGAFRWNLED